MPAVPTDKVQKKRTETVLTSDHLANAMLDKHAHRKSDKSPIKLSFD